MLPTEINGIKIFKLELTNLLLRSFIQFRVYCLILNMIEYLEKVPINLLFFLRSKCRTQQVHFINDFIMSTLWLFFPTQKLT